MVLFTYQTELSDGGHTNGELMGKDNWNLTIIFNQPIRLKEKLEHLEEIAFLLFSSFIIPSPATYFTNAIH